MEDKVKIMLNRKEITANPDKTILEVAKDHGFEIPTLCHDKYLEPYGSCWLCAVELKNSRNFVPACATKIVDGMEIETDNEDVKSIRKMALELLLSDHYADCIAPCTLACPARVDIQGYISLVNNGLYHEAVELIKQKLPLPLSVGRVCPAFCEAECRRTLVDEPVAIRQIKRFAADKDIEDKMNTYEPAVKSPTEKEVAIVGAGPAGLTVAYYLTIEGHKCTIFEAMPKSGGMLRYGIPNFRLPKDILDKEIGQIEKIGVEIKNNEQLGRDFTLQFLCKEYDSVFLGMGAWKAVSLRMGGQEYEDCYLGIDFLRSIHEGKIKKLNGTVAVIGGGNTAVDAARTSLRLGADKVMIIYRRAEEQMPADEYEIAAAKDEGIEMHLLQNPVKIIGRDGKIEGIQCVKMRLGDPDSSGRRRPIPIQNTDFIMKVDILIPAISQFPDSEFLLNETSIINGKNLELTRWNTIKINEKTKQTNIDKIFAGGDVIKGPSTVIESVADAYIAAKSIDQFLKGEKVETIENKFNSQKANSIKDLDPKEFGDYKKKRRIIPSQRTVQKRIKNFKEVEETFTEVEVKEETSRCIECGCEVNENCPLREYATEYDVIVDKFMGKINKHPIDKSHPFILREPNKCINCGICIRTCLEIQGVGALGYINRGFQTLVAPDFGESLLNTTCESCGKCIDVCPVGALTAQNTKLKLASYKRDINTTTCSFCGCGCKIKYMSTGDKILSAKGAESSVTDNDVCFNSHFGYEVLQNDDRLLQPLIKKDNKLQKCDWTQAFAYLNEKLANLGRDSAIFSNGNFTNEEFLLLNKIIKKFNIDRRYSWELNGSAVKEKLGINYSPNPIKDLYETELIIVIGNIPHTLKIKLIKAHNKGKKIIVINSVQNTLTKVADLSLITNEYLKIFNQFARYFVEYRHHDVDYIVQLVDNFVDYNHSLLRIDHEEEYKNIIEKIIKAKNVIFVYSESDLDVNSQNAILNLCILSGCLGKDASGIVTSSEMANKPTLLSYDYKLPLGISQVSSALIFGEDPLYNNKLEAYEWLNNLDFLLVADSYFTETAKMADIVLPLSTFVETNGTVVNSNNIYQSVNKIVEAKIKKENWQIFNKILKEKNSFEEIKKEANNDFNPDESRIRFDDIKLNKVLLSFDDAENLFKTNINYNTLRKKIEDLKTKYLKINNK